MKNFKSIWIGSGKLFKVTFIFLVFMFIFFTQFKIIFGFGASMSPTIKNGQVILCGPSNTFEVDDIIHYKLDGRSIVHRIVEVKAYTLVDGSTVTKYVTKGDGNPGKDDFDLYKENIKCKVYFVK